MSVSRPNLPTRGDPAKTVSDEGATVLFERGLPPPGERCFACPHRHVRSDMSHDSLTTPILPTPPLHGPRAAPPPGPLRATPGLPRPALLPAVDPNATLVLPDALKPAGPEAETIERPAGAPRPAGLAREAAMRRDGARPAFDELASPDITMMQQVTPARPARPRRPPRPPPDARAYFLLNLCLGLLIVAGLAVLVGRGAATPAAEDHADR